MRISDWSSDVCSSDVVTLKRQLSDLLPGQPIGARISNDAVVLTGTVSSAAAVDRAGSDVAGVGAEVQQVAAVDAFREHVVRSEEHTSELQSLMRISYAVFCLKKKKQNKIQKK